MFIPRCNRLNVRTSVAHLKYYIVHLLVISFVVYVNLSRYCSLCVYFVFTSEIANNIVGLHVDLLKFLVIYCHSIALHKLAYQIIIFVSAIVFK